MNSIGRNRRGRGGFTLIELMAVLVILGLLATTIIVSVVYVLDRAKYTMAQSDITKLEGCVQTFHLDQGRLPASLDELVTKPADAKQYPDDGYLDGVRIVPSDPWGNGYFYRVPGPDGRKYIIGSYGRDGKEGGDGWDKDLDNWTIRERR